MRSQGELSVLDQFYDALILRPSCSYHPDMSSALALVILTVFLAKHPGRKPYVLFMRRFSYIPLTALSILIYPAVITTVLLYLYPLFTGCEFPPAHKPQAHCYLNSSANPPTRPDTFAPFRLLAFGDPQLEGDTSLPDYSDRSYFPSLERLHTLPEVLRRQDWKRIQASLRVFAEGFWEDAGLLAWSYRKRLDLLGNDFYLAHIHRTLHWWLQPTHIAVLGDLIGSQWISDAEFASRADRFWNRVFKHGARIPDSITSHRGHNEVLGADPAWSRRVINIPGNHDVGYAGDLTAERLSRYEDAFGAVNWDITFALPRSENTTWLTRRETPAIKLVMLNSMNLDSPALDADLQAQTYDYINDAVRRSNGLETPDSDKALTLLLTHIPLRKPAGVCADSEYFTYHEELYGGGIREQNHLSVEASRTLLEGIMGLSSNPLTTTAGKRKGLILSGHDHEGCAAYHHVDVSNPHGADAWTAVPYSLLAAKSVLNATESAQRDHLLSSEVPGVREETLRSMMGSYGGHAGLVSAWYDEDEGWQVEIGGCDAGVQHLWWGVHVLDIVVLVCAVLGALLWVGEEVKIYRGFLRREKERGKRRERRRSKSRSKSLSVRGTPKVNGTLKGSGGKGNGSLKTPRGSKRVKEEDRAGSVRRKREDR